MTLTRKILFTQKYEILCNTLNLILGDNKQILPDLKEYDFIDLVFLIQITFENINENNYKTVIKDLILLNYNNIDDDTLEKIYDILYDFIKWFKLLR